MADAQASPLATHVVAEALATRAIRRPADPVVPYQFGVFDRDGEPVDFARLRREWPRSRTINPTGSAGSPAERREGTFIYGGVLINQFGHFLLETLARCWAWRTRGAAPVVFHCERPVLLPWQAEVLAAFGLPPAEIVFVTRSIAFERLVVPQPGYVISSFFHADHMRTLAFAPSRPVSGRKLWISRRRLGEGALGTFENEPDLEALLQERGWTILHPQEHPFAEQIRCFAGAERIAGIEGSALHSIIHLRDFRGAVSIVPRTPAGRLNSRNYGLIATTKGIRQRVYRGPIAQVSGAGAYGRLALGDVPGCAGFLDET